jgi:ribosome-associated protein
LSKKIEGNATSGIHRATKQVKLDREELDREALKAAELADLTQEELAALAELEALEELEELEELAEEAELEELEELEALEDLAALEAEDEAENDEAEYDAAGDGNIVAPAVIDEITSEEKAEIAAAAADSLRADDIIVLDLRQLTIIADFFLICTGKSSIQIRSITDRIEERLRDHGLRKLRTEGYQEATWILLDYGDVVCHVMAAEQRAFYDLEAFWSSAPRLELDLKPESTMLPGGRTQFESLTPVEDLFLDEAEDR